MGLTRDKKLKIFKRDKGRCQRCDTKLHVRKKHPNDLKRAQVHHITPVSQGGTHGLYNMMLTCGDCEKKHHGVGAGKVK